MITALKITEYIYEILNVSSLTSLISGNVYRIDKPKSSEKEDVVINILPLPSGFYKKIQNGTLNINCYCKIINGVANIRRLQLIENKVIEILENYNQANNNFYYEISETHILKELQQNSMSFSNIKLNIHKIK